MKTEFSVKELFHGKVFIFEHSEDGQVKNKIGLKLRDFKKLPIFCIEIIIGKLNLFCSWKDPLIQFGMVRHNRYDLDINAIISNHKDNIATKLVWPIKIEELKKDPMAVLNQLATFLQDFVFKELPTNLLPNS